MPRLVLFTFGCLVVFGTQWCTARLQPDAIKAANALLGETWYQINLDTAHVGYMHSHAYLDHLGHWHFDTTTHFALEENAPNTIAKHLTFAAHPPHPLISARYLNRSGEHLITTDITSRGPQQAHGLSATIERGSHTSINALDWSFDLGAFVAFETWLSTATRQPDQEFRLEGPDFERLRLVQRTYRVVEYAQDGYIVATNAPFAETTTQLDLDLKPLELSMAGIFEIKRSTEAEAIALQSLSRKTNYLFPVDRRILDHPDLVRLKLRMHSLKPIGLPNEIEMSAARASTQTAADRHRGEELRFPITHPTVQRLVQQAHLRAQQAVTEEITERQSASNALAPEDRLAVELVTLTHQQLEYAEEDPAGSVLAALARGRGECTDFADLYTTLARAAGFSARTVYGLAYKDGNNPAFMFHAWNEVHTSGRWHTVDPTWNQTWADATHIPLTDLQAARMMRANNTLGVSFEVLETEYLEDAAE